MANDKLDSLVSALIESTRLGKSSWRPGSREDTFIFSGASASVILLTVDNDGFAPYVLRLVDSEGRTVQEEEVDVDSQRYRAIVELYVAARNDSLNIDKTIDALLDELGDPNHGPS